MTPPRSGTRIAWDGSAIIELDGVQVRTGRYALRLVERSGNTRLWTINDGVPIRCLA